MTTLEKVIYMADYIEPTRAFEGVERLRKLAYEDLDRAMLLGLEMSIKENLGYGNAIHESSIAARDWLKERLDGKEETV